MDGRCKNCKWWTGKPDDDKLVSLGMKVCTSPHVINGPGVRESGRYDRITRTVRVEPDEALYSDGSDYFAEFATGPEFGCVQFEAKD